MSDFDAVIERAKAAVQKGIADVTVDEVPETVSDLSFEGRGKGKPVEISEGTHRVRLVIEWKEMAP